MSHEGIRAAGVVNTAVFFFNADNIPTELKQIKHWVCWREDLVNKAEGALRKTKVPFNAHTGRKASSTDPGTWSGYEEAVAAVQRYGFHGLGFVLTGNGIAGIDLDHCVDAEKHIAPWAARIVADFPTYWEISPSGEGLRGLCRGKLPPSGRKKGSIELYETTRYVTITGDHLSGTPSTIEDCSIQLLALHGKVWPAKSGGSRNASKAKLEFVAAANLSDSELLAKAMAAKNGAKLKRLWDGNRCDYGGDKAASDLGLCTILAFWTGGDASRLESLFNKSKLVHDSWENDSRYRRNTIQKAIELQHETYNAHRNDGSNSLGGTQTEEKQPIETTDDQPIPPGIILLPNDYFDFSKSAKTVFSLLAETKRYFIRGSGVVELQGSGLVSLTNSAFRSRLDRHGSRVMAYRKMDNGALALVPKRCSRDSADALLETIEAREILPSIRLIARLPIIVPGPDGVPVILGPGYHPGHGGVLITGKEQTDRVEIGVAVKALIGLLADFDFPAAGDTARAIAALVTPALRMGMWFTGPSPVQSMEADHSQAGKTLLQEMIRQVYGERAYLVAKKEGGVGSFDESLSAALLSGKPFIALDNMRGKLDSQFLEAAITWSESVSVRVPHHGEMQVDATAVTFQLSSNGIETTRDLANRCSITRIRKQPSGYVFKMNREEILTHIDDRRTFYLGCVFAVVKAWASAGRPKLSGDRHDFQQWAGILGWIAQELFKAGPLMDGHADAQARVSNPALSWLRAVCLAAETTKRLDTGLSASAIAELCENEDIDLPGLHAPAEDGQACKHVGKLLARCYHDSNVVQIDCFQVHKTEVEERDEDQRRNRTVRRYRILRTVRPEPITSVETSRFRESCTLSAHSAHSAQREISAMPTEERL